MMRSPPPPVTQQQQQQHSSYGNPYQPQGTSGAASGAHIHPAYGGFLNDQTAQMGFQVGKSAVMAGQEYMEQNVGGEIQRSWGCIFEDMADHVAPQFNRYINVSALKHYFNVSNSYVLSKLLLVLFPWRHRPWSRKQALSPSGQEGYFLPPREDINSPDMYIPGINGQIYHISQKPKTLTSYTQSWPLSHIFFSQLY